ncbi:hypothetical protein ABEB36_002158 [Hypothenemus hampei]|uniref:GH18 domain-containing protein n=1 Tax=Hypothenemus hampei TaxID=57062 RepID=A0ABD1F4T9_HYPHA
MDVDQKLYLRVTGMKERNSNLKVLLSVGGYSVSAAFKGIASDPNKRAIFVKSSLSYLETYNFDGLDIDWEYPEEEDRETYILLLKELKEAFEAKGYLLTAAVNSKLEQHAYNLADMLKYLDFINIMCYDFYGSWSDYTGQNSALYASSVETAAEKRSLNVEAAANKWVTAGAPKSKLAIGTAFYGRSFTLSNPNNHGIHAPITGAGEDGGEDHYVTICSKYDDWERIWDSEQMNPYKLNGDQWLGYDDVESIGLKAQWIKTNGFFGVMIWAIDQDDINGLCGEKQVLLKEINKQIAN